MVIGYHDNDPDKPYIVGRHTNQFHEPPWPLPANQALSGWMSEDLEGPTTNSVVTDDTPGKLQVQVATLDASQADAHSTIKVQNDAIRGGSKNSGNPSPEMTRPDVVVASAAGIAMTATDSTHLASMNDHVVTAGRDYSLSAGANHKTEAGGVARIYLHSAYTDPQNKKPSRLRLGFLLEAVVGAIGFEPTTL